MYDYNYGYDYSSGYADANDALGLLGGLAAIGGIISIISLVAGLITLISTWKIYKKAGKKGWESIIPIYNIIVLLQIVELPKWYIVLFFIPIANIYAMFKIYIELAHKFGKSTGFGVLTIFFGVICLPILAFGKNNVYVGTSNNTIQINNTQPMPNNQFQNPVNNMNNDSLNNNAATPSGVAMFNQNINTDINPINQVNQNTTSPVQQPVMDQNIMTQPSNTTTPNVIPSETMMQNNIPTPQENNVEPINNGINMAPDNAGPQPFVYNANPTTMPNQTEQQMPQPIPDTQPVDNMQPINVIPGMGATPQPVMQPQNPNDNPNNTQM